MQAQKFGARLAISRNAKALDCSARPYRLALEDGSAVQARTVMIATGARYRKLDVPDYARFEGQGSTTPPPPWRRSSAGARR